MAKVTCRKEDSLVGLYVLLDKHDYENLTIDKVRVYSTTYYRDGSWQVWSVPDVDMYAMPIGEYTYKVTKMYENNNPSLI